MNMRNAFKTLYVAIAIALLPVSAVLAGAVGHGGYTSGAIGNGNGAVSSSSSPTSTPTASPSPSPSPTATATAMASASPSPSPTATPTSIAGDNNFVIAEATPLSSPFPLTRAYDFDNSMGANIHVEDGGTMAEQATIAAMVAQTGITHLRDSMTVAWDDTAELQYLNTNYGVKYDLIIDPTQTAESETTAVNTLGYLLVEAMEGDNECNQSTQAGCGGAGGDYATTEKTNQSTMFTAMRAISSTIAVLGPSNTIANGYNNVGDISSTLDFGVMHNYTSWRTEENSGWAGTSWCDVYATLKFNICVSQYTSVSKPVVSTEGGWCDLGSNDAVNNYGGDTEGCVPSDIKADYVARDFTFSWMSGVPRTYYFELGDDDGAPGYSSHGLYNMNGVIKPSGTEVANLHALVYDSGVTAATFTPSDTFGASINAFPTGTNSVNGNAWKSYAFEVQKSDGSIDLLYWSGCEEYDGDSSTPETCPATDETLTFTTTPTSITNWTLNAGGFGEATQSSVTPASSITITFKPQLQILQLGTSPLALPTQTPGPAVASPSPSPSPSPTPSPLAVTTPGAGSGVVSIAQTTYINIDYGGNYGGGWVTYPSQAAGGVPTTGHYVLVIGTSGNANLYPYYGAASWFEWDQPTFSALTATDGPLAYESPSYITGYTWGSFADDTTTGGPATTFQWNEAAPPGGPWSVFGYDLANVDTVSPISEDAISNSGSGTTATCPTVTVPRTGSLVICRISIVQGYSGSGVSNPPTVPTGWAFDGPSGAAFDFNLTFTFHLTSTTTTASQIVPAMTTTLSSTSQEWFAETLVVQPPT